MEENKLEILISTMDKNSLNFLSAIFVHEPFYLFNILIVNQSATHKIVSSFANVRVINSTEKGLSKSRNLAIQNARGEICLLADDDVVFEPNFSNNILEEFMLNDMADIISFNHTRQGVAKHNTKKRFEHNKKCIIDVCSIEIAFDLRKIRAKNIYFDENFGLGSPFETAEEFLFVYTALKSGLKVCYAPIIICSHPSMSSGINLGDDKIIIARAALNYKLHGWVAYFWLAKYLFFLYRHNYIGAKMLYKKYILGYRTIKSTLVKSLRK